MKNAHCENIHTAYAAVIYQTGPKILAHFTIQSNVAWKTVFLESGYVCLIVCLLHGQENAFMPCYIAHLSEFTCRVSGPFFLQSTTANMYHSAATRKGMIQFMLRDTRGF